MLRYAILGAAAFAFASPALAQSDAPTTPPVAAVVPPATAPASTAPATQDTVKITPAAKSYSGGGGCNWASKASPIS